MKSRIGICCSILLLFLAGCATVKKKSDVEFVSQNRIVEHIRVDSVMLHDSVYVKELADTVFYTRYRTVYKERLRIDTIVRCDTLFREREVVVEREHGSLATLSLKWKMLLAALLLFLLWRAGMLSVLWGLILKGVQLCKRIFHLKE